MKLMTRQGEKTALKDIGSRLRENSWTKQTVHESNTTVSVKNRLNYFNDYRDHNYQISISYDHCEDLKISLQSCLQ